MLLFLIKTLFVLIFNSCEKQERRMFYPVLALANVGMWPYSEPLIAPHPL